MLTAKETITPNMAPKHYLHKCRKMAPTNLDMDVILLACTSHTVNIDKVLHSTEEDEFCTWNAPMSIWSLKSSTKCNSNQRIRRVKEIVLKVMMKLTITAKFGLKESAILFEC